MADSKHLKANIHALASELNSLPEASDDERVISTREAVRLLLPMIQKAQRRGYTLDRIVQRLAERGVTVTTGTLRGYLRDGRKKKGAVGRGSAAAAEGTPGTGGGQPSSAAGTGAPPEGGRGGGQSATPSVPSARPDGRRTVNGDTQQVGASARS